MNSQFMELNILLYLLKDQSSLKKILIVEKKIELMELLSLKNWY